MLLITSFIAFEILNSDNSFDSSALDSILVMNRSLYHKTCDVSSLKYDQNSAETILRCSIMQVLFYLTNQSYSFLGAFPTKERASGFYLDSCLPGSHSSSQPSQQVFNVSDCHITVLQKQVHVVEVTKYVGLGTQASQQTLHCEIEQEDCFCFLEERFQPHF